MYSSDQNLKDRQFDRLLVIEYKGISKWGYRQWLCRCDCGNTVIVSSHLLKAKKTKSCGCLRKEMTAAVALKLKGTKRPNCSHPGEKIDLTNERFYMLLVKARDPNNSQKWICACDCGAITSVTGGNLRNGHTKSCGCLAHRGKLQIKSE